VVDLVEEGVDVALRVRPRLEDSGSLVVKNLGLTRTLLVASPDQLARQGIPNTVTDLDHLDTVSMSAQDGRSVWQLVGPGAAAHALSHQPRLVADDLLTLKLVVLKGTGMGLLPDYMCREELHTGQLVLVLPGWAPPPAVFHAVFPSRRGLAPTTRRFLDFLGEHLSSDGMLHAP
jgi:DNA-binding transcriptional LysR family regulator